MKKNIIILFFLLAVSAGCDNGSGRFENKLFIDASDLRNEVRVDLEEKEEIKDADKFKVSVAMPLSYDLEVAFEKSPELLDTYRKLYYDEEAVLLPDECCDLSGVKAVIKAGNVSSGDIVIPFVNLGEGGLLDYSKRYVLPVTAYAAGIDILPRSKTMYFVVKKASLVNVAAEMYGNCVWPDWENFPEVHDMEHFTFEALVLGHAFSNESGLHTVMGVEERFLVRVGDTGIPLNQLQVSYGCKDEKEMIYNGKVSNSYLQLDTGRWYHVAVTFDGGEDKADGAEIKVYLNGVCRLTEKCVAENKDTKEKLPIGKIDFMIPHSDEKDGKPRCFWVGYSYDSKRPFNGLMAEVRVWNRVLSEDEIKDPKHPYRIYRDPKTGEFPESLVAYWKFDDKTGKNVKDYSVYGNDMTANHDFIWYPVNLPE